MQVEGAKYLFEPRTIRRMELLVLGVLDWRLRSVTPFSFLDFFACKLDSTGTFTGFLNSRATQIILSNIQGMHSSSRHVEGKLDFGIFVKKQLL